MIDEDDDIPVLTRILRTGGARSKDEARPPDPTSMADPLVIGNEPHVARAASRLAAPFDDDEPHDPARYAVTDESSPNDRAVDGPHERRVNPFVSDEPRERRQAGDVSLQRLASITSSVRDSVLIALQTRIDTELDARIAQAMHREVETAIAHLQDKLREGLTDALRDVVARAVYDEMTRFVATEREATARLDPRKPPVRVDA